MKYASQIFLESSQPQVPFVIKQVDPSICKRFKTSQDKVELKTCSKYKTPNRINEKIILTPDGRDWIGYIGVEYNEYKHVELSTVCINRKYRGGGYFKVLMNLFPDAQILFVANDNLKARKAYEKYGWINSGQKHYFDLGNKDNFSWLYYNPVNIKKEDLKPYTKFNIFERYGITV